MGTDNWQEVTNRKHRRTNDDDIFKISKSVYVTNFPESTSARDLWKTCSVYGMVVDVFIPSKTSKASKRFSFVRFINVVNLDHLVEKLWTIWIGSFHLFANKVHFERPHKPNETPNANSRASSRIPKPSIPQHSNSRVGSYANIVNDVSLGMQGSMIPTLPALVLDDTCLVDRDLSNHAMGKVTDFSSIPNLYTILNDKGFLDVKLSYLGGLWVLFKFNKMATKVNMMNHTGVNSWFQITQEACNDFVSDELIVWGETLDLEDNVDTSFVCKRLCVKTKHVVSILETFKVIIKGKVFMVRAKELFTRNPTFLVHKEKVYTSEDESIHESVNNEFYPHPNKEEPGNNYASDEDGVPKTVFGSSSSLHKQDNKDKDVTNSEDPFRLYDLLKNKKGFGHKTKKEWIKALTNSFKLNFLAIQETKTIRVSNMDVKFLWGNSNYDYVCSDSLGSSGGILCIWEALVFKKDNVTVSDNFIAIYETWLPSNSKILLVAIYAPQRVLCKKNLWDYISIIVGRCNGETIIMGDFNKVRSSDERRGSCFNPYSARHFDRFISNSGLVDVTLEGYAFTWAHPSASKMSKLDRFLVSDGIFSLFPSITALCLDRHLSDHRPILLWEIQLDFGPTPFRFYHSWFDYFCWVKAKRQEVSGSKNEMISELGEIDKVMDRGEFDDATIFHRFELKRKLLNVTEMEVKDRFQKSKVKWAVEGDENSNFFHGIINKRRSQLAIHGIFVDDLWQTEPDMIKDEKGVSRDEIRRAVWSCGDNKSSSPDGYTFEFFKKYCRVVDEGLFKGIQLPGSISISHIFYADDAMFIGEWSYENLKGVMMGECFTNLKAWDDVILKLRSRLSKWKVKTLSIGSRLTLLKLVLGASPIYYMSIFQVPLGVLKVMESIHSRFFNEMDQSDKKFTSAAWKKVLASKKHGRLGVSSFFALNRSLLLKWVWRFISQDVSLWERFDFWSYCKKCIGNGNDKRFCFDCWIGDIPLHDKFPRLFALELDKEASVAVKLNAPIEISFRRNARGGLKQHLMADMNSMLDLVVLMNFGDRWVCDLASDGNLWVKEVRNFIDDLFLPRQAVQTR
nr:RNA-directed DNA polymerase, eukaryota [Tanacetum cinerariifolium]